MNEMIIGFWFFFGALGGLMWLYQLTDVFKNRTVTFNDIKAYCTCLALGFISFGFILLMTIITFFEQHGDDSLFSWGESASKSTRKKRTTKQQQKRKPLNDPWRKVDD